MNTNLKTVWKAKGILLSLLFLSALVTFLVLAKMQFAYRGIIWGIDDFEGKMIASSRKVCREVSGDTKCKTLPQELSVNLGVYDPDGVFTSSERFAIEHHYVDWNNSETLLDSLNEINDQARWPLLTIEPWNEGHTNDKKILKDIVGGQYDEVITNVCNQISDFNNPIFVRWGHEMDNVTDRYPWSTDDGKLYISAYKYFVDKCRKIVGNDVYFVWSPEGNEKMGKYWPGKEYADYIGLSIYSFGDFEDKYYGGRRTFVENFGEKYERSIIFDRPILIAEMGVDGSMGTQEEWLYDAFSSMESFEMLKTVVYFNAKDLPDAWGTEFTIPDWRIKSDILR